MRCGPTPLMVPYSIGLRGSAKCAIGRRSGIETVVAASSQEGKAARVRRAGRLEGTQTPRTENCAVKARSQASLRDARRRDVGY
jgi:hypothetical protein